MSANEQRTVGERAFHGSIAGAVIGTVPFAIPGLFTLYGPCAAVGAGLIVGVAFGAPLKHVLDRLYRDFESGGNEELLRRHSIFWSVVAMVSSALVSLCLFLLFV